MGFVRHARIKISAEEGEAVYHCSSRTVNGEHLFSDVDREVLRRHIWQVADYCGVQILTYAVLANHFHVLVRIPIAGIVSDAELIRRYLVLYPQPSLHQAARLSVIKTDLATNSEQGIAWRRRQLALMGDVSPFMKLLKQRFSIWFNKAHGRFGTLWAERFKSVLLDTEKQILKTVAAYVDLNAVRAGLAADSKDYRFCGYAEAVAGNKDAQEGICFVVGGNAWSDAQAHYRELIFGTGAGQSETSAISIDALQRVVAEGGHLPLSTLLRCRLRYFTDGAVLGRREFVDVQLAKYREKTGYRRKISPRVLPLFGEWGEIMSLRGFRKKVGG